MNFLKTLLDQEQKNIAEGYYKDLDIKAQEEKLLEAVDKAQTEFWKSINKSFPELTNSKGKLPDAAINKFDTACHSVVDVWVSANLKESVELTEGKSYHNELSQAKRQIQTALKTLAKPYDEAIDAVERKAAHRASDSLDDAVKHLDGY